MYCAIAGWDTLNHIFLGAAIVGGMIVIFRLFLQFVGGGGGHDASDAGSDISGEASPDVGGADHDVGSAGHHADSSFAVFTLQNLSAFLLIFGLVGLALRRASEVGTTWSVVGGFAAGMIIVAILTKLMTASRRLQVSGTLKLQNAIGAEGEIYLTVPPGGIGKVQVVIRGRQQIYNAKTEETTPVKTGERVIVTKLVSGNVFVVKRA